MASLDFVRIALRINDTGGVSHCFSFPHNYSLPNWLGMHCSFQVKYPESWVELYVKVIRAPRSGSKNTP